MLIAVWSLITFGSVWVDVDDELSTLRSDQYLETSIVSIIMQVDSFPNYAKPYDVMKPVTSLIYVVPVFLRSKL